MAERIEERPAGSGPSAVRTPLTKNARHSRVAALLSGRPIRSQQELGALLADQGVHVTQATLSRDLGELGAFKVRTSDGSFAYALPDGPDRTGRSSLVHLARRLEELLLSTEAVGSSVVLRTPPGGAHLLASSIDAAELAEVAGTIAGDDTVLLICRTLEGRTGDEVATALSERLLTSAEGLVRSGDEAPAQSLTSAPAPAPAPVPARPLSAIDGDRPARGSDRT